MKTRDPLQIQFALRAGLPEEFTLKQIIDAVQAIPYGRPASRTPEGVVREWKGTCSTKHALLAMVLREQRPELRPRLVHRVYHADRASVRQRHGTTAATAVPEGGLIDVHRYMVITIAGRDLTIDVTFPDDPPWDGRHSMTLACGEGQDIPAGSDPDADKAALEASYCDPRAREPFIAALAAAAGPRQQA